MDRIVGKRRILIGMAGVLLLVAGISGAAAAGAADEANASSDTVDLGEHHLVIEDATVRIADTHVTGPGLPEKSVDRAEYTIEETTVSTDEFDARINGHDVRFGALSVTVDNVGVILEDVSVEEPSA